MAEAHIKKVKPADTVATDVTARKKRAVDPGATGETSTIEALAPISPQLQWLRANYSDFDQQLQKFARLNDETFGKLQRPIAEEGTKLTQNLLNAIAAKRKHFNEHIAIFWEVKQRLTSAERWRSDLPGNENRTAETNQKNFGAADWADYCERFVAYSLSSADKKLATFEQAIKTEPGEGNTEDSEGAPGDAEASSDAQQPSVATIQELGIKIARDLVRITTILDSDAAARALQALVREAEQLLSLLGKPPEVAGKGIGANPAEGKAINGTRSSALAKGKTA